ncbi:isoaspartyl dipeptidase [Citrobacter koseri]|nr:isoaspartyl dipeptidase [Citrobacter koseri]
MDCSILNLTLFQCGHVYAPDDLGQQDILVATAKLSLLRRLSLRKTSPVASRSIFTVISSARDLSISMFISSAVAAKPGRIPVRQRCGCHGWLKPVLPPLSGCWERTASPVHPESLLAKTRALEYEGISAWMLTGAYSLPSPTITGSVDRDVALIDKVIGVKCAVSDHRSSAPNSAALATMAAQSRVGGLLGQKPGISVFHMGDSPHMLEPLYDILANADVPITKLLPTHVNRAEPAVPGGAGVRA